MRRLRATAEQIWRSSVQAVRADRLVEGAVRIDADRLGINHVTFPVDSIGHVCVVGGGKASGAMAAGLVDALGPNWLDRWNVTGWVNVPDNCRRTLPHIYLHAARPAGRNEPTLDGVQGTERILELVSRLDRDALCIVLISGGGSALLPAPCPGISLDDKLQVTRAMSEAGADIVQLNTVRRALSRIKGGGLARHCTAGRMVTLIISDVLGDPLDIIASGPTLTVPPDPMAAVQALRQLRLAPPRIPTAVWAELDRQIAHPPDRATGRPPETFHVVLANNQTAVDAAVASARRLGFATRVLPPEPSETTAELVGRELAERAMEMGARGPECLVWGGEPVVRLVDRRHRGCGGRNQQVVLAAMVRLEELGGADRSDLVLLSGGTDGEDGPTDAAGAVWHQGVQRTAQRAGLDPQPYLDRNDAYAFFEAVGGLIKTGPTETNVCDVRLAVVSPTTIDRPAGG